MVGGSLDGLGDTGVTSIRANDDAGLLRDTSPVSRLSANAGDPIAVPEEVVHGEAVPELSPD